MTLTLKGLIHGLLLVLDEARAIPTILDRPTSLHMHLIILMLLASQLCCIRRHFAKLASFFQGGNLDSSLLMLENDLETYLGL